MTIKPERRDSLTASGAWVAAMARPSIFANEDWPKDGRGRRIGSNKVELSRRCVILLSLVMAVAMTSSQAVVAASWDPAAPDYAGRKGKTFYVSKLGDNSDGTSWKRAFHTIQAALAAIPDAQGGHRVI